MNILLYDGKCSLCNKAVLFILKNEKNSKIKFASLQSIKGKEILTKYNLSENYRSSIIFVSNNLCFKKSDAVIEIMTFLKSPWKLLIIIKFIPKSIRDFFYSIISKYRYIFFKRYEYCIYPDKNNKERFIDI